MPAANTPDHYFSAHPASPAQRRPLRVRLAGEDREIETSNGIFSPERIDDGTRVLLDEAPQPPAQGNLLDIGCGWGPIALTLALESPQATVWAVDVNDRALDLVRRNAERLGLSNVRACRPEEVPADIRFAQAWSNPPIRVGKEVLHDIMHTWLPRLDESAEAWLVVQKNLGADSFADWLNAEFPGSTERVAVGKGYRILRYTAREFTE
ncbi:MAG TPA: methyltransferase [Microbacteriaceae bacterium]|nr:methyltransferase [Microbacteriaceae bacterium]